MNAVALVPTPAERAKLARLRDLWLEHCCDAEPCDRARELEGDLLELALALLDPIIREQSRGDDGVRVEPVDGAAEPVDGTGDHEWPEQPTDLDPLTGDRADR